MLTKVHSGTLHGSIKHQAPGAICWPVLVRRLSSAPAHASRTTAKAAPEQAAEEAVPVEEAPSSTEIPKFLNSTPHPREMRRYFYQEAAESALKALAAGHTRMKMRCTIPELNPEMDVYRVGTLLEWVREVASQIAEDGKRVKVCVQGSMGEGVFQGMPLSLSGVARIMSVMDWGEATEFVTFGEVGKDEVDDVTDVYILIAPQNIVGNTIMTDLGDMTEALEAASKSVILVNPVLKDIPGHSGIMGISGREGRVKFADSFEWVYHFRLLFVSGYFYPIKGALRKTLESTWQVYKRVDLARRNEEYQMWGEFDSEPSGGEMTDLFKKEKLSMADRAKQPVEDKKAGGKWW